MPLPEGSVPFAVLGPTVWQLAVSIVPVGAIMLTGLASGPIRWYAALVAIIAYTGTELDANRRFRAVYAEFGDALSADVIISIVLIVAGILVTLRR